MKLSSAVRILAVAIMAETMAEARGIDKSVAVYIISDRDSINRDVKDQALGLAHRMFSNIDVDIRWHSGRPSVEDRNAIVIELTTGTPVTLRPDALAYALPYEGVHIQVFWDRVNIYDAPSELLAHVLVHEITHILEGIPRHSENGVMKACWSNQDFKAMRRMPMRFAPVDIKLIHLGLEARNGRAMASAVHLKDE